MTIGVGDSFAIASLLFAASVLFVVGIGVLALGARAWSDAVAASHRARAHGLSVDETTQTLGAVQDAAEDVRAKARGTFVPPTEDELQSWIIEQRHSSNGRSEEYTTDANNGVPDEQPPIRRGGLYNETGL
ncbi:MAG: hypothetical protein NVS3B16_24700 [Vulcanimicrobiaceae bacterium]